MHVHEYEAGAIAENHMCACICVKGTGMRPNSVRQYPLKPGLRGHALPWSPRCILAPQATVGDL